MHHYQPTNNTGDTQTHKLQTLNILKMWEKFLYVTCI